MMMERGEEVWTRWWTRLTIRERGDGSKRRRGGRVVLSWCAGCTGRTIMAGVEVDGMGGSPKASSSRGPDNASAYVCARGGVGRVYTRRR